MAVGWVIIELVLRFATRKERVQQRALAQQQKAEQQQV